MTSNLDQKLVAAFDKIYESGAGEANNTTSLLMNLNIPNVKNYNPNYLAVAYIIANTPSAEKADRNILLISKPGDPLEYQSYIGMTVLEILQKVFPIKDDQDDLIIYHLQRLLCYVLMVKNYMQGDMVDLEENIYYVPDDAEDAEEEYEEYSDDD